MTHYRPVSIPVATNTPQHLAHLSACVDCGALVLDLTTHDRWHSDLSTS